MEKEKQFLFEVSWEVCNKVGGIHTVIVSKLQQTKKHFNDSYILIGPWLNENRGFTEVSDIHLLSIKHKLDAAGIEAKVGYWDYEPKPIVVLVKYEKSINKDKLLYDLWEEYGVDSMTGGWDYVEPVLFAHIAGRAIEAISSIFDDHTFIAHFHEWMGGAGLFYLKKNAPHIATVFTTHATILGRSMSSNGIDIYKAIEEINADKEAVRFNVLAKFSLEKTLARQADCFTTVSQITSIEAESLFQVKVHQLVPNGFDLKTVPSYKSNPEYFHTNRKKLLDFAAEFLQKPLSEKDTFIISTSGRYEFHNKGIDVFIDTLGKIKNEGKLPENKELLVYFFVLAGAEETHKYRKEEIFTRYSKISTHPLWNPSSDPIVNACNKYELVNNPGDKINIIFIPVYLNGFDGLLNMEYYEALSGSDLSVYPSYYEPWGYTPLESIAYGIPTVTTDLSGFGRWIQNLGKPVDSVAIINRNYIPLAKIVESLSNTLMKFITMKKKDMDILRIEARETALNAEWDIFYKNYLKAYDIALKICNQRLKGALKKDFIKSEEVSFRAVESIRPRLRNFTVKSSIPEKLEDLRKLAYNLYWAWTPEAHQLFNRLDPILYDSLGNNPVSLLETIDRERLDEVLDSESYMHLYDEVIRKFNKYTGSKKAIINSGKYITPEKPVAYFSMEFGFHESIPIFSGGLGVLSGDHIKSASDLNIPMVGLGLLYRKGYFKQGISKEGEQKVVYFNNDFHRMPVEEVIKRGKAVIISIEFPGRVVYAKVWRINVGRVPVYMLDTDILENSPSDREITSRLYGGGKRVRIEQEMILGIGGVKLINELNITPSVYHMNEGHSAFLILQRFINQMKYNKLDFETAREVIRSSNVFTTHTPVPAGNESFDMKLVENYLHTYAETNGLTMDQVYEISGRDTSSNGEFEMTVLALKNSIRRNGVSKLHGAVSRQMWTKIWPGFLMEEIPITHVTNGVHVGTWLSTEIKNLLQKFQTVDYQSELLNKNFWEKIHNIPDKELWQSHINLKSRFFNFIRERITDNWTREGEDPAIIDQFLLNLTPSPLTIGFARRFATYKRANLIFRDFERLRKILTNHKYPVQFIFAGKAHPDDLEGALLIKEIVNMSKKEEFLGKIIFLEDYDIALARKMVAGVDLWLNNPIRPLEASGTSGMKAGINGVINCSILDGWWDEGYNGHNGWAIGEIKQYKNHDTQRIFDSESFYDQLESDIIPSFYTRNPSGIPTKWVDRMKHSMVSVIQEFNTHRMLNDYMNKIYLPAAKRYYELGQHNFDKARKLSEWIDSIRHRFPSIHIKNISMKGSQGDGLNVNDEITVRLELNGGRVSKAEINAQLVVVRDNRQDSILYSEKDFFFDEKIQVVNMIAKGESENNDLVFSCRYTPEKSGKFNYGIRVLPYHDDLDSITDLNLVYWA